MAPKIEKTSSILSWPSISRTKDGADGGSSQSFADHKNQEKKEEKSGELEAATQQEYTFEEIQSAVNEYKKSDLFIRSGLKIEVVKSLNDGFQVRLFQVSGAIVRGMSPQEFMKLKKATGTKDEAPGKILDQTF